MIEIKEAKKGTCILYNDKPYRIEEIKSVIVASHSHAKTKITIVNVFDKSDRQVLTLPHSERFADVQIPRKHGQYIARMGSGIGQVMDMRDYSMYEAEIPADIDGKIKEGDEVTYLEYNGRSKVVEIR